MLFFVFAVLLLIGYVFILYKVIIAWDYPRRSPSLDIKKSPKVSIIVPARNEASQIKQCLESLSQQSYPTALFEIILIDDHSTDSTVDIANSASIPNLKIISLANHTLDTTHSFKKQGITLGVKQSSGDIIVTTDADCTMGKDWLTTIVSKFENADTKATTSTVLFTSPDNRLLTKFQQLDMLGMMAVTNACHHYQWAAMANGANLAYRKDTFYEVNGFEGSEHIASGDDMFLIQKIIEKYPDSIRFIPYSSSVVYTQPVDTWEKLIQQRIRWATKSKQFKTPSFWAILLIVGGTQAFLTFSFVLWIGSLVFSICCRWDSATFICLFLGKGIMDYVMLRKVSNYYDEHFSFLDFAKCLFIHIGYFPYIGFKSFFTKKYTWKGRKVS